MKFRYLIVLVSLILLSTPAVSEEGNTNISVYTGTFDVIDKEGDDQTSLS